MIADVDRGRSARRAEGARGRGEVSVPRREHRRREERRAHQVAEHAGARRSSRSRAIKVGIIGASTEATPFTTMPANFVGPRDGAARREAIADEAKALREQGCAGRSSSTAHIGSKCKDLDQAERHLRRASSNEELFDMIGDLPKGSSTSIVAGHTHAAIAHRIDDIAVIESYSSGRAFGRVDLRISPSGHVTARRSIKPQVMCRAARAKRNADAPARTTARPATTRASRSRPIPRCKRSSTRRWRAPARGATRSSASRSPQPVTKSYGPRVAEGNWFCRSHARRAARGADVALTNGGGLRADMPAGDLTYGQLFEAMPFDNRFAIVELKGKHLRRLVARTSSAAAGSCRGAGSRRRRAARAGKLDVAITVARQAARRDRRRTSSSRATSSRPAATALIGRLKLPEGSVKMTDVIIRDGDGDDPAQAEGHGRPDRALLDAKHRAWTTKASARSSAARSRSRRRR